MAQAKDGRITRAMLQAFLENPSRALTSTEPRTEIITIAGYAFTQVSYGDGSRLVELGEFEVDSDQSLASKIETCGFVSYDITNPGQNGFTAGQDGYTAWINEDRYPFQQKGKRTVRLALIVTGKTDQHEKDFAAMAQRVGRKLCDHAHGLAVAERYPDLLLHAYIVMYGARGFDQDGRPTVLVLYGHDDQRWLGYRYCATYLNDAPLALVAG